MKENTAVIFSDDLSKYDFGEGHPFRGNDTRYLGSF